MTVDTLPENDCHFELRKKLLGKHKMHKPPICISVAWDWQFSGVNAESINREVTSCLECQALVDQRRDLKCLAIPKASILAHGYMSRALWQTQRMQTKSFLPANVSGAKAGLIDRHAFLSGISPSLVHILEQNISFIDMAMKKITTNTPANSLHGIINIAPFNDTEANPLTSAIDPDGNDYFCTLCSKELENVYLHCDGCEQLLHKDFNICMECYQGGYWRATVDMQNRGFQHPIDRTSCMNHIGDVQNNRGISPCNCIGGSPCRICNLCTGKSPPSSTLCMFSINLQAAIL